MAAAAGDRLHALGPWTGGDGSAARRLLRLLPRPLLPLPRSASQHCLCASMGKSTPMKIAERSVCEMVPTLAAVVGVDSRWAPCARTGHAKPNRMCTP